MTATLVRSYEHQNPLVAGSQGNVQALPNGDWMVGWGQAGYLSEVDPAGQVLFNAHLPPDWESYRTYVLPWSGQPAQPPALVADAAPGGQAATTVYASWNGATEVASWQRARGRLAREPRAGRQRRQERLRDGDRGCPALALGRYMQVQALDARRRGHRRLARRCRLRSGSRLSGSRSRAASLSSAAALLRVRRGVCGGAAALAAACLAVEK